MSLVPTQNSRPYWPQGQRLSTSTLIAVNTLSYLFNCSLKQTALVNVPFRLYNVYQTKNYSKECLAFAALFLPYGFLLSAGVDVIAEVFNDLDKPTPTSALPLPPRLDPQVSENAFKILGLEIGEESDKEVVKTKCKAIVDGFTPNLKKASRPLAEQLQGLIDDAKAAYKTLTGEDYQV
jgi:hypothetical protein